MTHSWTRLLATAALSLGAGLAWAGDVYVVTGSSTTLAASDVPDVYRGEKQFAGGTKLVVLDNASVQSDFLAKALKIDGAKYAAIWAKKVFREGLTTPISKGSDAEVLAAIKANPATVGYVSRPSADVKVVGKF